MDNQSPLYFILALPIVYNVFGTVMGEEYSQRLGASRMDHKESPSIQVVRLRENN